MQTCVSVDRRQGKEEMSEMRWTSVRGAWCGDDEYVIVERKDEDVEEQAGMNGIGVGDERR
jgi:hypothetical protein